MYGPPGRQTPIASCCRACNSGWSARNSGTNPPGDLTCKVITSSGRPCQRPSSFCQEASSMSCAINLCRMRCSTRGAICRVRLSEPIVTVHNVSVHRPPAVCAVCTERCLSMSGSSAPKVGVVDDDPFTWVVIAAAILHIGVTGTFQLLFGQCDPLEDVCHRRGPIVLMGIVG